MMAASFAGAAPACPRPRRARPRSGLAGIEFGVNIPGTVGGAVRMNANAYGGELGRVLDWVDVSTPGGHRPAPPGATSASPTAGRISARGEVVARAVASRSNDADPDGQGGARRHARPPPRGPAVRDQDFRLDLQEPRRPSAQRAAPPVSCSRRPAARAFRSAVRDSARSTPTSSRTPAAASTADVLELIAEGRRRVRERFGVELEPEVQLLGEASFSGEGGGAG